MVKLATEAAIIVWINKANNEVITKNTSSYFFKEKTGTLYSLGDSPKKLKGILKITGRSDVVE